MRKFSIEDWCITLLATVLMLAIGLIISLAIINPSNVYTIEIDGHRFITKSGKSVLVHHPDCCKELK